MSKDNPTVLASSQGNGNSAAKDDYSGTGILVVWGTFDGATATLQIQASDGTWISIDDQTYTAAGADTVNFASRVSIRLNVAGGGGSESINAEIQ